MKNKNYLFLQMFAEGEETGGAEGENGSGTNAETQGTTVSFDDFLSDKENQAEFDRRVQKAITTAVENAKEKWKTLTDTKVSEAEKLSQMTAEEREKYRAEKAEKELAELKKQIALRDMSKEARNILSSDGVNIPDEIIANLVCDDAEKTKEAVQAFSKAFKDAVQDAVKEALKGKSPKTGGQSTLTKEKILAISNLDERRKAIAENIELFSDF